MEYIIVGLIVLTALTGTAEACTSAQLQCNNGACVPIHWKCDGEMDCPSGSDESGCAAGCPPDMFQCAGTGQCIRKTWVCDGDSDCGAGDTSDEDDCAAQSCQDTEFECGDGQCIPSKWVCDRSRDCTDGLDEDQTRCQRGTCASWQFTCDDGMCIDLSYKCDNDPDCSDGEDESPSICVTDTPSCKEREFKCHLSETCISISWVCDGEHDCYDASDEANCATVTTTPRITTKEATRTYTAGTPTSTIQTTSSTTAHTTTDQPTRRPTTLSMTQDTTEKVTTSEAIPMCPSGMFPCFNGECKPIHWKCDGEPDCPSGSDESGCETDTEPITTVKTTGTVRPPTMATKVEMSSEKTESPSTTSIPTRRPVTTTRTTTSQTLSTTAPSTPISSTGVRNQTTSQTTSRQTYTTRRKDLKDVSVTTFQPVQTTDRHKAPTGRRQGQYPNDTVIIIAVFVPGILVVTTLVVTLYCCCWKKKKSNYQNCKNGNVKWGEDKIQTIDILNSEEGMVDMDEPEESGVYTGPKLKQESRVNKDESSSVQS